MQRAFGVDMWQKILIFDSVHDKSVRQICRLSEVLSESHISTSHDVPHLVIPRRAAAHRAVFAESEAHVLAVVAARGTRGAGVGVGLRLLREALVPLQRRSVHVLRTVRKIGRAHV